MKFIPQWGNKEVRVALSLTWDSYHSTFLTSQRAYLQQWVFHGTLCKRKTVTEVTDGLYSVLGSSPLWTFQETRLHPFPLLICCERVSHRSPFNTNHRADLLLCCSLWVREKSKRSYLLAELAWLKRNMKDSAWFLRSFFLHCQNLKSVQGSFWKDPWVWAKEQSVPTDLSSQMRRRTHSLGSQFLFKKKSLKTSGCKGEPLPPPHDSADLRLLWASGKVRI